MEPETRPMGHKARPSYVVRLLLAGAVLYFAYDLSRGDRGPVDWVVLSAIGGAILWNGVQASRRLIGFGGGQALWHLLRTVLFWILGAMNTALIRPEDVGSWKNLAGWAFLVLAGIDSIFVAKKERAAIAAEAATAA